MVTRLVEVNALSSRVPAIIYLPTVHKPAGTLKANTQEIDLITKCRELEVGSLYF